MNKIKLLITSVGSLVGKNILDVLDSPLFPRRELVYIIGTNSLAEAANNFRCDACYLVPPTASLEFLPTMLAIINSEKPDLVLNGRDADTYVISDLLKRHPHIKCKTAYGEPGSLNVGLDKWQSYNFAKKHNLPFAETFVLHKSGDIDDLKNFADSVRYPIIAKPAEGFASTGVFFARTWPELSYLANFENYVFQEYLGSPESLSSYFQLLSGPPPLFAHPKEICIFSSMTVIGSSGQLSPIYISMNKQRNGATIDCRKITNDEIERLSTSYARAYYKEGGYGPMNVQYSKDREGQWKALEINLRIVGLTYSRLITGFDEIGMIISDVLPDTNFPIYRAPSAVSSSIITRSLSSFQTSTELIRTLEKNKFWSSRIHAPIKS